VRRLVGPQGAPERAGPQVRSGRSTTEQCCAVRRGWSLARLNSSVAHRFLSRESFSCVLSCIASRCHRKFRRAWIGHVERVCDSDASEGFTRPAPENPLWTSSACTVFPVFPFSNGNYMVIASPRCIPPFERGFYKLVFLFLFLSLVTRSE